MDLYAFTRDGDLVTSVTVGGVAATLVQKQNTRNSRWIYQYRIVGIPANTALTVNVNTTGTPGRTECVSVAYNGVVQSTTPDATAFVTNSSANPFVANITTVEDNCWVSMGVDGGGPLSANSNCFLLQDNMPTGAMVLFDNSNVAPVTPAGSFTMQVNNGTSAPNIALMASWAPISQNTSSIERIGSSSIISRLIAYWKLDESSGDALSTTNGAVILTNNGSTPYAPALINNGIDFGTANTNKFLRNTSSLGLSPSGPYSCSFWVKVRTAPTSGQFQIFKDFLCGSGSSQARYQVFYFNNSGTKQLIFRRGNASVDNDVTYNVDLGTSSFFHIGYTYNGSTVTAYVNGVSVGTVASSGVGMYSLTNNFTLGTSIDAVPASGFSFAYIDEVGVWEKTLSGGEVTTLYNSGIGIQYPFGSPSITNISSLRM